MPFPGVNAAGTGASSGALANTNMPATDSGGGYMNMLPMLAAGAGGLISTFGSQPSAPQRKIGLGASGQQLEKQTFNAISSGGIPLNLASRYIGQARKIAQSRRQQGEKTLLASASGNLGGATSGRSLGLLQSINQQRLSDSTTGRQQLGQAQVTQGLSNLQNLNAFASQQLQVPVNIAQNRATSQQYEQMLSARRGAAIGSMAEIAGASYFYA